MKLKDMRLQKGYTQEELAKKAGIAVMSYYRYEYGERVPNTRTAIRIAKILNTTVEELWDER